MPLTDDQEKTLDKILDQTTQTNSSVSNFIEKVLVTFLTKQEHKLYEKDIQSNSEELDEIKKNLSKVAWIVISAVIVAVLSLVIIGK